MASPPERASRLADTAVAIYQFLFHNDDTGASAHDPAILLKIVLFAYSLGNTSSREIAQACRENIVFMDLAADNHSHFTTIAAFVASISSLTLPLWQC